MRYMITINGKDIATGSARLAVAAVMARPNATTIRRVTV